MNLSGSATERCLSGAGQLPAGPDNLQTAAMALCYLAASAGGITGPTILGWIGQTWSLGIGLAISGAAIWLLAGLPLAAYVRARRGQPNLELAAVPAEGRLAVEPG
jgi:dipeptide/tripeptide permease